jgi:hypothetical protein
MNINKVRGSKKSSVILSSILKINKDTLIRKIENIDVISSGMFVIIKLEIKEVSLVKILPKSPDEWLSKKLLFSLSNLSTIFILIFDTILIPVIFSKYCEEIWKIKYKTTKASKVIR